MKRYLPYSHIYLAFTFSKNSNFRPSHTEYFNIITEYWQSDCLCAVSDALMPQAQSTHDHLYASVEEDEKRDADVMARFKTYAIFEFLTKGDIMARLEVMAYVTWSDMGSWHILGQRMLY